MHDDHGAAMVEFVALMVVLVVPLVYLILTVFEVQRTTYAATSAAREAARLFVTAPTSADAGLRARQAASVAVTDHGVTWRPEDLSVSCSADPCLTPGASVRVIYRTSVDLPLVPGFVSDLVPLSLAVQAQHTQVVDRYVPVRP